MERSRIKCNGLISEMLDQVRAAIYGLNIFHSAVAVFREIEWKHHHLPPFLRKFKDVRYHRRRSSALRDICEIVKSPESIVGQRFNGRDRAFFEPKLDCCIELIADCVLNACAPREVITG